MPVVTRESNASVHPGRVVLEVQRKKRTKQEIADDNAKAKARAIAAKQEAANKEQAIISAIAGLRASVEREEEAIQARAHRPDLGYSSQAPNTTRTASTRELQVPVRAQECGDITDDLDSAGLNPRASPDEIEGEEDDATYPRDLMDDIMMSEQGSESEGRASNGEEILDFPESDHDEDHAPETRDMDMDPDGIMPDVAAPALPAERHTRTKVKKNNERGNLRRQVEEFEQSLNQGKKRKAFEMSPDINPAQVSVTGGPQAKQLKKSYATYGGLSGNWREKIDHINQKRGSSALAAQAISSRASSTPGASASGDSEGMSTPAPGEFDNDEPTETLERVRSSKCAAPKAGTTEFHRPILRNALELPSPRPMSTPVRRTQQMGMELVPALSLSHTRVENSGPSNRRGSTRKLNPTTHDLPLPSEYIPKWGKILMPQLCAWAGSTDDPFCANNKMDNEIDALWRRVFPDFILENADKPVVLKVAGSALYNWRSEVGKAARSAVLQYWKSKGSTINTLEDRSQYAKREITDLRFVYKDPGVGSQSGRPHGIFCSNLMSITYAAHLKKVKGAENRYGDQIGGLALVTVAVECALSHYEDVNSPMHNIYKCDSNEDDDKESDGTQGQGFLEKAWGEKARQLQQTIVQLGPQHWAMIKKHAEAHLQLRHELTEELEDKDTSISYPHTRLIVDW